MVSGGAGVIPETLIARRSRSACGISRSSSNVSSVGIIAFASTITACSEFGDRERASIVSGGGQTISVAINVSVANVMLDPAQRVRDEVFLSKGIWICGELTSVHVGSVISEKAS